MRRTSRRTQSEGATRPVCELNFDPLALDPLGWWPLGWDPEAATAVTVMPASEISRLLLCLACAMGAMADMEMLTKMPSLCGGRW